MLKAEAPSGSDTWGRICEEIEVLACLCSFLGDRCARLQRMARWRVTVAQLPTLEFLEARRSGLPILSFFKELDYDTERDTEVARKRDAFRAEVTGLSGGMIVAQFRLAHDLVPKVAHSVVVLANDSLEAEDLWPRDHCKPLCGAA